MTAYYNEIDPYAAQWLRNLIDAGHIAPGVVDERSIEDVTPNDLRGFTQHHFFAGLGGWSLALRLAGWPDDRPVWTGSCPCQPFSAAGKGAGFADERHLWPAWQHLIDQCRPAVVFGEQVASKAVDAWIDLVHADMEGMGYAFGCIPFPSAGVGAPHIRDRTYWLADASPSGRREERADGGRIAVGDSAQGHATGLVHGGMCCGMADADCDRAQFERGNNAQAQGLQEIERQSKYSPDVSERVRGDHHEFGNGGSDGLHDGNERPGPTNGFWRAADWLGCTDGKWRPVEPGTFPLAHGIPNRVGRLRAYGNAINPHQAAEFALASGLMLD